jgi:mannose-1-phosphate guanylyltransferase
MAKRRKVGRASLQVDHDCSGRWGVILAGGDGKSLLPLTRKLTGEDRPKQVCALSGTDTLLKETWQRVSYVVPQSNILLVLTRTHERFYVDQIRGIPTGNLLGQPYNRGTAPYIAFHTAIFLMRCYRSVPRISPCSLWRDWDGPTSVSLSACFLLSN